MLVVDAAITTVQATFTYYWFVHVNRRGVRTSKASFHDHHVFNCPDFHLRAQVMTESLGTVICTNFHRNSRPWTSVIAFVPSSVYSLFHQRNGSVDVEVLSVLVFTDVDMDRGGDGYMSTTLSLPLNWSIALLPSCRFR